MIEIGNINSTPTNMVLDIKDANNTVKVKYAIGEKDEINKELMQRHDLSISFNYPTFISFKKGDYVSFDSIKYYLMNDYKAVENNGQYKYDLVFHGKEMLFQDVQYWYDKNNVDQSEYGMTGNATYFLQLAVENINKHYGANFVIQGNAEPTEIKYISFANNTNVFDALNQVCNTFECEWLLEGDTINIVNKANFGDAVDFKVGEAIQKISRRDGDNTFDAQRILALGSTRNLTESYQGGDYMIGSKRLRIPTSKGKYIDLKPDLKPTEIKTATVIFDEIYPHRVGTMTAVRSVEYKDKDDDGNETILKQWRFKDNDIIFSEDYKLPDLPLTIVFQTGELAGLHFDVEFVKSGYEENDNSQYYEIEANESYGAILPNDTLKPEVGDKYILYNFNIELVSHVYVPKAENELFNYATKWLKDEWVDKGVYECPIMGRYARDNNVSLEIGQRVDLYSPLFNGKRESRVMAYSKPLLSKFDATYTIGDNKAYSSKSSINQRITKLELTEYADYNVSTGIGDVYVIKQFDNTRPSDFNVYSAKASNAKYFNKQTGDTVQGDTQFMRNVQTHGINISDVFQNSTFTAGALGSGFQVKRDSNGESYAEFDNLFVRKNTVFTEITKAEIKSVGGLIILSLADLTASDVVDNGNSYRVYFDTQEGKMVNKFALNDQVICQTFNGVEQKRYWRLVTSVGENYIDISKTDAETNSKAPIKGDDIVQLGNRTDANRQHAILLSAYGSDAPSIKQYSGINSYSLEGKEVTKISPSGNMFKGTFSIQSHGTTSVIYKDRGLFANGNQYYKNDRVSWLGSLWVCLEDTKTIPSETATYWRKETSGQTDINNSIDNIKIGGVNLAFDSSFDFLNIYRYKSRNGYANLSIDPSGKITLNNSLKITSLKEGSIGTDLQIDTMKPYRSGVYDIIFSFYAKTDMASTKMFWRWGFGQFATPITITKDWNKFSFSLNAAASDSNVLHPYFEGIGTIWISDLMIEYGNKATSWSPAPVDVASGISNAQNTANDAQSLANSSKNYIDNVLQNELEYIRDQIDGKVNSYFYDYAPTVNNIPASEWTTEEDKENHLNDTFTNTYSGLSWRWLKVNGVYDWVVISDTAATEALTKAAEALQVAKNKMQVFVNTPYTPYQVGDLWVQGTNGDIMTCTTSRVSGNFISSDWSKLSKYTDDTAANEANSKADNALNEITVVRSEFNSKLSVQDDKINAKVSQQDFNALGWRVSTVESNVTQLSGSITSTVEKVDNIKIGGRNLFVKSRLKNGWIDADNGVTVYSAIADHHDPTYYPIQHNEKNIIATVYSPINEYTGGAGRMFFYDENKGYLGMQSAWCTGGANGSTKLGSTLYNIPGNAAYYRYCVIHKDLVCKIEYGNKATDYSIAPEDIFTDINSKNRVFYQDAEPIDKHVGDLWIMKSFTDSNGIINADQTKNIYQLQKRWNGTTWQIVGQNVNKSKVEQTDSQIRQTVEKTGIDQLGQGQNLYSVFNQRADEIEIEVSKKTTEAEVKAGIKVTPYGVNVYGNEFRVDSTLIAKAIEAEDLKVGSRDKGACLEVSVDKNDSQKGYFYVKGSKSTDEALVIDSGTQSIEIISPYSASGISSEEDPESSSGKSTVSISSQSGGIRVSNDNHDTSIVSASGIFANNAGQGMFSGSTGIKSKASIVGLGLGNVSKNLSHDNNFVAGVYGSASNSGSAPAFGGYFDVLKANGLVLSCKRIKTSTTLDRTDCHVSCYNDTEIDVSLPFNPYNGQVIYIRLMSNVGVKIYGNGKNIHTDGNIPTWIWAKSGIGDTSILVFDGLYWCFNYMVR